MPLNIWDLKAGWYHGIHSLPLLRRISKEEIDKLKFLMTNKCLQPLTVLAIGTGTGLSLEVFPSTVSVFGMDRSKKMIKRNIRRKLFSGIVGEACCLPFEDCAVYFISALGLTEYLPDKKKFLQEVRRILCSGGHFLVTIALPGIISLLRNFLGNRIYAINTSEWESLIQTLGFEVIDREHTLFQVQYLISTK